MTTTMNTGAASLSDEQILALRKASAVLCGTGHHEEAGVINSILAAPAPQADAAIAAGGAQEPVNGEQA
jgi:hypothetical protein